MRTQQTSLANRPRRDGDLARITRAAALGDDSAWAELVKRFGGLVWAVTRSHHLNTSDAADVVQSTWLSLFQYIGRMRNPAGLPAWLTTTTRRECVRALAASRQHIPYGDALPEPAPDVTEPVERLLRFERRAALREAINHLYPHERELLTMLATDPPPTYGEISAALDMPIGSIGPTRARCIERLRQYCAPQRSSLA